MLLIKILFTILFVGACLSQGWTVGATILSMLGIASLIFLSSKWLPR